MVSISSLFTLFFFSQLLIICMHSSNARLLLQANNVKPSSTKPLQFSVSLQVLEKNGGGKTPERTGVNAEIKGLLTGNADDNKMKIDGVYNKEGSEMVEDHMDLLKAKHEKVNPERPPNLSRHHAKEEEDAGLKSDDIVVMDYQPPHRKTPIHNK